jgi:hypothetical protein
MGDSAGFEWIIVVFEGVVTILVVGMRFSFLLLMMRGLELRSGLRRGRGILSGISDHN